MPRFCSFSRRINSYSYPTELKHQLSRKRATPWISLLFLKPLVRAHSNPSVVGGGVKSKLTKAGKADCLKELCSGFHQNSNRRNCYQIEWNIKWSHKLTESINNTVNTKVGTDRQTWRRLKRIENVGFETLKCSFLLFVTFDVMLWKYICWTRSPRSRRLKVISGADPHRFRPFYGNRSHFS